MNGDAPGTPQEALMGALQHTDLQVTGWLASKADAQHGWRSLACRVRHASACSLVLNNHAAPPAEARSAMLLLATTARGKQRYDSEPAEAARGRGAATADSKQLGAAHRLRGVFRPHGLLPDSRQRPVVAALLGPHKGHVQCLGRVSHRIPACRL